MKTNLLWLSFIFSFLFVISTYSQQGKVDATFNTFDNGLIGDGFDSDVKCMALQADGKLIVGGSFLNFNGATTPRFCRLLADGSKDNSFSVGSGFDGIVYAIAIQLDGKIIIGGSFTSYNGSPAGRLIRLNPNGSRDSSFDTSVGAAIASTTGVIYTLGIQTDGSLIIGGTFIKYNNSTANRIARILSNGNLDTSFVTNGASSGAVNSVQIQSNGKILVGGTFTSFHGTTYNRIVRLNTNGSIDTAFAIGTGFDNNIRALTLQSDGKILIGGDFLNYNTQSVNRIARLNTDGSLDITFISGSGFSGATVNVSAISTNALGAILVGGSFTGNYNGSNVNRLVLLDSNGTINPNFDIGSGPATATVLILTSDTDGSWYAGGSFAIFDSQNQGRLAKINAIGTLDLGYLSSGAGFDNSVLKVISVADNKTMVFGNFSKFNGANVTRITRLLETGIVDATFNSAGLGTNSLITCAVVQPDSKIIFAGNFTTYNGVASNRIARITSNGVVDGTFNIGIGFFGQIYSLVLQPDGKIIVVGNCTSYKGIPINRITRLLPDGTLDTDFNTNIGSGANAIVETAFLQADGKIIFAGNFTTHNGISANRMVRVLNNGTLDPDFTIGSGFDKYVYALALQSDGKIIVGGSFTTFSGLVANRLVRLNANGTFDSTFLSGTGFSKGEIRSLLVQPDNRILAGGTLSGTYNGISAMRLLRLQADGTYDPSFSVHLNGTLYNMCFTANFNLNIAGNFNSVSGISKHRFARLKLCVNSSTWNGTNWSNGLPSYEKTITFNGNHSSLTAVNACSCSIANTYSVTVLNGNTLELALEYSGLGTLILENNASLLQTDDQLINSGTVVYKRETSPILKYDYTYWSSPVFNQKLISVSPNTPSNYFYSYNAVSSSWFNEVTSNIMQPGKGYIIRGPLDFSSSIPSVFKASFSGIPNNGIFTAFIGCTGTSNLIGNPYPSAIDADTFIHTNSTIIEGTLYFWTHNTPLTNNGYVSNDYAAYNILGGIATHSSTNSGVNNNKPNGKIAAGQAFFTTSCNGGGTAIFNNSMRMANQNTLFYKQNLNQKEGFEKHRIWLNLKNKEGAFKQILVGYISAATNEYDTNFDGKSYNGNSFIDFYSINAGANFVIQGRALPFQELDEVPLGFSTTIKGTFTINCDEMDGLFVNQPLFLEDKLTNTCFDLKKGAYSFETNPGTFNTRFVLVYTDKKLSIPENSITKNQTRVIVKNNQINIISDFELVEKILVYDLLGRIISENKSVNNSQFSIRNLAKTNQVLLVKILFKNGQTEARKVLY